MKTLLLLFVTSNPTFPYVTSPQRPRWTSAFTAARGDELKLAGRCKQGKEKVCRRKQRRARSAIIIRE